MARALVVCIDGTWNHPGQHDKDPISGDETETATNVARTWEALTGGKLNPERPYGTIRHLRHQPGSALYINGVGSAGTTLRRELEGATGNGIAERVRDAYRYLAERWEPGDEIFGFGFSRGAFAIRSLMGFVDCIGIQKSNNLLKEDELAQLYHTYKYRLSGNVEFPSWTQPAKARFLGLWDTVGGLAFGREFSFYHDIRPKNVERVCHALALDEERKIFHPEPWHVEADAGQRVDEVWFAGAHTNVGGGYCDANLSNIALFWVLNHAKSLGLEIDLNEVVGWGRDSELGVRRPSYREFWGHYPVLGTIMTNLGLERMRRVMRRGQRLHESVVDAMGESAYVPVARTPEGDEIRLPVRDIAIESWGFAHHQAAPALRAAS
jgi:uncharacterized protein (DUF2235 family)